MIIWVIDQIEISYLTQLFVKSPMRHITSRPAVKQNVLLHHATCHHINMSDPKKCNVTLQNV